MRSEVIQLDSSQSSEGEVEVADKLSNFGSEVSLQASHAKLDLDNLDDLSCTDSFALK